MSRAWVLTVVTVFAVAARLPAQAPHFKWEAGKDLTYRVTQITKATETKEEKTQETTTRLDLIKKWKVLEVDKDGVATVSMALERLRMETKAPNGDTVLFDSAEPAKSTPALRDEMAKYVGAPVLTVRLNNRGQLMEVKECKFGPPSRLETDLPFKIVLPGTAPAVGQEWERKFTLNLEPVPGQKQEQTNCEAVQTLTCKSVTGPTIVFTIATKVTNPPESPVDQIPLLPLLPSGEVTFDTAAGRLTSVKYNFAKELKGTQGENSKYNFVSTYVEEFKP